MALRKAGDEVIAVLPDALHQIVSHANVERAVPPARKNINKESHEL